MIDTHCHVDLYPDPTQVASDAGRAGVLTVLVTNLPSAFDRARAHAREFPRLRLALGLHPLLAESHAREKARFRELVETTSFIGEVGLDFSNPSVPAPKLQTESFEFVLDAIGDSPRFVTVHSRRAERAVLDVLERAGRSPVVFHWFTGPAGVAEEAISKGHYFSLNPAMVASAKSRALIAALPKDRVLTESDGPFVKVGSRPAVPADVEGVERHLAVTWKVEPAEVRQQIRGNFLTLIEPVRRSPAPHAGPTRI